MHLKTFNLSLEESEQETPSELLLDVFLSVASFQFDLTVL